MEREQPYVQNILTEVSQNVHGSLCSIMLDGIKITAEQGLKTATSRCLVCMLVLVTTLITKIHGKHLFKEDIA